MADSKYIRFAVRPVLVLVTIAAVAGGFLATRDNGSVVFFANDSGVIDSPIVDSPLDTPPPDTGPACHLIALVGQSNARGDGRVSELTGGDVALADEFADVESIIREGSGTAYPPTWSVDIPLGPTEPHTFVGINRFGVEVVIARDLFAARPDETWIIVKATLDSTSMWNQWRPSIPTDPNHFEIVHDWIVEKATETSCTPAAYIWIQGESDAGVLARANAYGGYLSEFVSAMRLKLGSIPFIYGRLHTGYLGAYTSIVRAGQAALGLSNVHMIDQDSYTLRSDVTHYTTASVIAMGAAYADKVLEVVP